MSFIREKRKSVFTNSRFTIYEDDVIFPDGKTKGKYNVLEFPNKTVVSLAHRDDEILMIESFRYPTNSIELELPAGGIEEGETPEQAAKRETLEETGYETVDHKVIYEAQTSNGISDHTFTIVSSRVKEMKSLFDKNEINTVLLININKVKKLLKENKIKDAPTIVALMLCNLNI